MRKSPGTMTDRQRFATAAQKALPLEPVREILERYGALDQQQTLAPGRVVEGVD
jgi:hypothetical protein